MLVPLKLVSDYSLLRSLIKIDDLITFLNQNKLKKAALVDSNLFGAIEFYLKCNQNGIEPIIGLDVIIDEAHIYLYAKNEAGYFKLIKLNTIFQQRRLTITDIISPDLKYIVPLAASALLKDLPEATIGYQTEVEKKEALVLTSKVVFVNEIRAYNQKEARYLKYLDLIRTGKTLKDIGPEISAYLKTDLTAFDIASTERFSQDLKLELKFGTRYIPSYSNPLNDETRYLTGLALKGLTKRYGSPVPLTARKRLRFELDVIHQMNLEAYFLIVYDYVLYAKKNDILVGPGRGSAASSLVCYCLGITEIDPLRYHLLFERFLNPERVTLPDIDIDFEATKRNQVIAYVKSKYGSECVAPIITYGTLASRQVIRDVGRVFELDSNLIDELARKVDSKLNLKANLASPTWSQFLNSHPKYRSVVKTALVFEGLKRHVSTHAAGIVISSKKLDDLIPVYLNNEEIMTGYQMEYLENLGLLKMDFLALKNLTIIAKVLQLIKCDLKKTINLNKIDLEDPIVYELFQKGATEGVFQFESTGMKNMLRKLKPSCFNDLIASVALFRPGPMENINRFIRLKAHPESIVYADPILKDILAETYGVIVYQEQIMQLLVKMGGYTLAEADNLRRAMSKKKADVFWAEKDIFVKRALNLGFSSEVTQQVFADILRFANYGFNKAHSVSYAMIGYQMAYLKQYYPRQFMQNLLNLALGSEIKTKEYITLARENNLTFLPVDINRSTDSYQIYDSSLLFPLNVVKNVGTQAINRILEERKRGSFKDFSDFVTRTYSLGINKLMIENLIKASAFTTFGYSKRTLIENLPIVLNYATLVSEIDARLVLKPEIVSLPEYEAEVLRQNEFEVLGFYVTNHPAAKYRNKVKAMNLSTAFNQTIQVVGLIEFIKEIKTKKGAPLVFMTFSDETGSAEAILFETQVKLLKPFKKGDLVKMTGKVTRRYDQYKLIIANLTLPPDLKN